MFRLLIVVIAVASAPARAETLSDPMRPSHAAPVESVRAAPAQRFELSAILYSADRRVAVVNGRSVREGQRVGTARVKRIRRGQVELQVGERTLTLALDAAPNTTRGAVDEL